MARLTLTGLRKVYDNGQVALHGVDLEVADGEFVVLVGPSGCGKSTTLRMVAGLESITAGRLTIGDREMNDLPPRERDIAMVFQNYALYPHMTVRQNLAFSLELRKLGRDEVERRVREAADILGLEPVLDRLPRQLSGGQRQRVAIGRAIVRQPAVFLFDEPLSNLDARLRVQTRREIVRLHRELSATVLYVTHDQTEAMTMGDRIVVLEAGHVRQVDTPMGLYERPRNLFVATFIGSPAMNLLRGRVVTEGGAVWFDGDGGDLRLPLPGHAQHVAGRDVVVGLRPEWLALADGTAESARTLPLVLEAVEPLGNEILLHGRVGTHELTARVAPLAVPPAPGSTVAIVAESAQAHLFDASSGERIESDARG